MPMDIKITGTNPAGILLGCLLHLKEHKIRFEDIDSGNEFSGQMQLQFPDRWLPVSLSPLPDSRSWDFHFLSPEEEKQEDQIEKLAGTGGEEVIVLNVNKKEWAPRLGEGCIYGLLLFEASFLQEKKLEIFTSEPVLILEKNKKLKKLFPPFQGLGIKVKFVEDIEPYYFARYIYKLMDLPLTLCNTTLNHFLSYKDGRKMLQALLTEGVKTFDSMGQKIAPLPLNDPRALLTKLTKQPHKFNIHRFYNDRNFPPLLQDIFLEKPDFRHIINRHFSTLAASEGIDPLWNNRLLEKLPVIEAEGFYHDPLELLKAME